MRNILFNTLFAALAIAIQTGCRSAEPNNDRSSRTATSVESELQQAAERQIGEYVVEVFEDSRGNLWFGTVANGVARYDGKELKFFTTADGLGSNAVVGFAETSDGKLWLATQAGLTRYDGKSFINFNSVDGLCDDRVSSLHIVNNGTLWIGTWGGVCTYDGIKFNKFELPKPDIELHQYQSTVDWVTEIIQDRDGNIWFARDGYGACVYDGSSFNCLTKADGLQSNNVQTILEDNNGNIWFGCRVAEKDNPNPDGRSGDGGVAVFDGNEIKKFPDVPGLSRNDIYDISKDRSDNIWIGANGVGLYRYDGQEFVLHQHTTREDLMPYGYGIQSIVEDRNGTLWLGLSGGLFKLQDTSIVNVTTTGPW